MSVRAVTHSSMLAGRFNEDAPRPPVPGEEDDTAIDVSSGRTNYTRSCLPYGASLATPRRSDLDLGYEPEGSASPAPAHLRWAESLHSLLDDQDGIALFRSFLQQEGCPDLLDFWFACSGFRKLPATSGADGHRLKLAKVIYRKYVSDSAGSSAVARRIKVGTKNFIRESVSRGRLDSALFEQAQAEVQALMEDNVYPLFLKSDTYLSHARATGGESATPPNRNSAGSPESQPAQKTLPYLPTLEEDAEWAQSETGCDNSTALTRRLLMETAQRRCRTGVSWTGAEQTEARFGMRELINPYYVNSGFARAPIASANDSELQSLSSDADTISLTDSSVDGIPPYRYRKQQQRRNMQESVRANGHVPLPHIPRTHRLPKDIHVEPQKFAAELISRLEVVQRERDNHRQLEERLHRVRMEEECEDADVSTATCPPVPKPGATHSARQWRDSHVENPESILDEHVQRVMKTPGCQSPRAASGSKHSEPPGYGWGADAHYATRGRYYSEAAAPTACHSDANGSKVNSLSRRSGRLKSEEGRGASGRGLEVSEEAELKQRHLQWTGEGERESTRYRKSWASARSGWVSEHHDAGGSAAQQEEARRRSVAQHCKPQRPKPSSSSSVGNGNGNTNGSRRSASESLTVAYYFCGEPIPYRTSVKGRVLTLRQFKELLTRKGAYRFYFKKVSDEFDCGVVYEEVREDDAVLPIYQERIVGKVEKIH